MAKIKINNLNRENQMVELDDKQLSNVVGGDNTSWHVYFAADGSIIGSIHVRDGDDTLYEHRP
jgi:bacteriocin-like protein